MTPIHFTQKKHYPWVVISLCAFFLFYKFILQVYPGLITHELMQEFKIHGAGLGNLVATYFYSYMVMQLFVGVLIDRFGTRVLAAIALLVSALGLFWFANAHSLSSAIGARLLMGLGVAFATVSYMKMAAVWFPANRFAFIGGLLATAAMMGAIFGQAPLAIMMHKFGWRSGLLDWGYIGMGMAVLFLVVVRDKHKAPDSLELPEKTAPQSYWRGVKMVFANKQNWLLTFYSGLAYSPIAVFAGLWGHPFVQQAYHLKPTEAATFITLAFLGLAVGGPLLGLISDRWMSKRRVMAYGSGLALVTFLIVVYIPHLPLSLLAVFLFLFGFGTGAFMLGFAVGRLLNPLAVAATVIALINSGDALFGAFTEPLVGKLLDLSWSGKMVAGAPYFSVADYQHAMLIMPIYLFIALLLLVWIRED
jgi:MFS family permease